MRDRYEERVSSPFDALSPEEQAGIKNAVTGLIKEGIITSEEENQIKNTIAARPIGESTVLTRHRVEEMTDKMGNKVIFERTADGVNFTYGRSEAREE